MFKENYFFFLIWLLEKREQKRIFSLLCDKHNIKYFHGDHHNTNKSIQLICVISQFAILNLTHTKQINNFGHYIINDNFKRKLKHSSDPAVNLWTLFSIPWNDRAHDHHFTCIYLFSMCHSGSNSNRIQIITSLGIENTHKNYNSYKWNSVSNTSFQWK